MTTSAHRWDEHYAELDGTTPYRYGDEATYRMAGRFMRPCLTVEDWGCGGGFLRQFIAPDAYLGIDGSESPFADLVRDLTEYRSFADGIVLRHVLEHEHHWDRILDNAVASFHRRLFVCLFTPLRDRTEVLKTERNYHGAPVIGFALSDILDRIPGGFRSVVRVGTGSFFGRETVIRIAR